MPDRSQLLKEIGEISFTVTDLALYLDTHPQDINAIDAFHEAMTARKQLLKTYADNFEPLTLDCVCADSNNTSDTDTKYAGQRHWAWSDGPLPWEGGTI